MLLQFNFRVLLLFQLLNRIGSLFFKMFEKKTRKVPWEKRIDMFSMYKLSILPVNLQQVNSSTRPVIFVYTDVSSESHFPIRRWASARIPVSNSIMCHATLPFHCDINFPRERHCNGHWPSSKSRQCITFHGIRKSYSKSLTFRNFLLTAQCASEMYKKAPFLHRVPSVTS